MVGPPYILWGACFLQALDLSPELWRIGTMCVCYMLPCLSVERRINNRLARLLSWSLGSRLLAHFLQRTVLLLLTVAVRCAKFRSIKCQEPKESAGIYIHVCLKNMFLSEIPTNSPSSLSYCCCAICQI